MKTKGIKVDLDEMIEETVRERLAELYFDLMNPFITIYDPQDPEREDRKVRKLRKAVKKVHNWFALPEDQL